MGSDFLYFWEAARSILHGQSPYGNGFIYPLPFGLLLLPFGLLPFDLAFLLFTFLSLIGLITLTKRQSLKSLFYLPVTFTLWVGQIDLIILALGFSKTWLGVALSTIKPQLAIWIVPYSFFNWWRTNQKQKIWKASIFIVFLYLGSMVIHPSWLRTWLNEISIIAYSEHSSSLFGMMAFFDQKSIAFILITMVGMIVFVKLLPVTSEKFWSFAAVFNPISNIYSLCVLIKHVDWVSIVLSWALLPVAITLHSGLPWTIIPIYLLGRFIYRNSRKL